MRTFCPGDRVRSRFTAITTIYTVVAYDGCCLVTVTDGVDTFDLLAGELRSA